MRDFTHQTRAAVLEAMKADAGIVALVGVKSIYQAAVKGTPTLPLIRYGVPSYTPFSASCMNGQSIASAIHSFAKGGDEKVAAIQRAIVDLFGGGNDDSGYDLDVTGATSATLYIEGGQILQDIEDAQIFHSILNIRVDVVA